MTKEELKQYLINVAGKDPRLVNRMCDYSLFNSYLVWNGIYGFTQDIINVYEAAFNNK